MASVLVKGTKYQVRVEKDLFGKIRGGIPMKFRVYDLDGDFDPFEVNGTELINYCRELRGENSGQEYPDPKNTKDAIKYLNEYCNISVSQL